MAPKGSLDRKAMFWLLPVLLLAILAVYVPHLNNDLVFDDHPQIEQNPLVYGEAPWEKAFTQDAWGHVPSVNNSSSNKYYRPLFTLTHRLTFQVGNGSPTAFHILNLSLHLIATLLAFFALRLLNFSSAQAFVATTFFGLHPLAGEVVYWASCTSEILLQIGLLASLICTISSFNCFAWKRAFLLVGAIMFLLIALFAKETAVVIAPILTLEILRHPRGEHVRRIKNLIPLWLITFVYLFLRNLVIFEQGFGDFLPEGVRDIGNYGLALFWYAKKFLWPMPLSPVHYFPINPSVFDVGVGLFILTVLFMVILLSLRYKPPIVFWLGWLVIPLALPLVQLLFSMKLASGIIVAERYMYLSLIPFCALTVKLFIRTTFRLFPAWCFKAISLSLFFLFSLTGGIATHSYGRTFSDDASYFENAYSQAPKNPFVLSWLGVLKMEQKEYDEALQFFEMAIHIDPRRLNLQMNRGIALYEMGLLDESVKAFSLVIKQNPLLPKAHLGLANAYRDQGRVEEAGRHYGEVLKFDPENVAAMGNFATYLYLKGDSAEAIMYWEKSLKIKETPEARFNLGMAYRNIGQVKQAKKHLRVFLKNSDQSNKEESFLALKWLKEN